MKTERAIELIKYLCHGRDKMYEEAGRMAAEAMKAQQKREPGQWQEKQVFNAAETTVTELQGAKCSACGLWHTTPYLYNFTHYKFCPNCGSPMER